jgi:tetraacyldisaccharide-1-P 4'-kinase
MMKKLCLRVAVALVSFAGLGITAKAQVADQIVVTIPFEFVVAGKTLPAGTYRVNRVSDDKREGLIFSSVETRASAIVHPIKVESAPADKAQVSFETVGDEHFLSKIQTEDNVFIVPVSRAAILLASGKSNTHTASGSSVGTN